MDAAQSFGPLMPPSVSAFVFVPRLPRKDLRFHCTPHRRSCPTPYQPACCTLSAAVESSEGISAALIRSLASEKSELSLFFLSQKHSGSFQPLTGAVDV
ncbi:hypothetical protein SDJN03_04406, partial [Cucurbita argyrosperma subsp. sororia]